MASAQISGPKARLHAEVLGMGAVMGGDDFEAMDLGFGGQVLAGPRIGDVSILGTGGFRRFGLENSDDHVEVFSLGLAPRYTIPLANDIIKPWVGGMGAVLFQNERIAGAPDPSSTGFEVGGRAGVGFQITSNVILNTCANLAYTRFGDVSIDGTAVDGSDTNGMGFSFGIGLWVGT
jgi:hypothetical protein